MGKIKQSLAFGLSGIILVSSLVGCTSNKEVALVEAEEKVEITFSWWGTDLRHEYTIDAIKAFEKQNPNIKVNLEYSEFTGFKNKTDIKMAAHTEADVMQLNYAWVSEYSPDGTGFYDIHQLSDEINLSNYTEEVLSYGMINHKLDALPIALNGQIIVYDEAAYQKYGLSIPESWEDLYKAAQVMRKNNEYPLDVTDKELWFLVVAYVEQKNGREMITETGAFNYTEQDLEDMISIYLDWVDKGVIEEVFNSSDSTAIKNGTVQWTNNTEKFAKKFDEAGGKGVVSGIPVQSGAKRSGIYVRPSTMYAISGHSTHPKEAAQLLEFLVSSEEMTLCQELEKGIPFNQAAKAILQENQLLEGIMNDADQIVAQQDTHLMHPKFEDAKVKQAYYDACISVYFGEKTLAEAAKESYEKMKALI